MYEFIKGVVENIYSNKIIIENNNIGYSITVANPFSYKKGEIYKVFVYQKVREDDISLFGFKTIDEKELFLKLITVSGIGPKTAISLFTMGDISNIYKAIENQDYILLTKFPGIGKKTAQQIILDLKGKISFENISNETSIYSDVLDALLSLGFKNTEIKKALSKLEKDLDTESALKQSLKLLTK